MKGVLPCLVYCALCAGTRDFYPALAALVSPVKNIVFLTEHYFNLCAPSPDQPWHAAVQGRLSLSVCLRLYNRIVLVMRKNFYCQYLFLHFTASVKKRCTQFIKIYLLI
jgi:hypothetical protein